MEADQGQTTDRKNSLKFASVCIPFYDMPKKTKEITPEVSAAAAALGSKGGKNGSGDAKKRDAIFYTHTLPEARRKAKLRRKLAS